MHYLDTSALVKLLRAEDETPALSEWARERDRTLVTSVLAGTELSRAVRRAEPTLLDRAQELLDSLYVLELPASVYDIAARLEPPALRSLDALHLAAALRLARELDGIVSYDERLNAAARGLGMRVVSPGVAQRIA